jgi:uncharacterized protein YcaQ
VSAAPSSLTAPQARRIALAAQGFLDPAHARPTLRTVQRALGRTMVLQIDSVNVLQRAHYMPLYSRLGAYDVALLHRAAEQDPRRLVEYWAHVAAFMPVELWPAMRHRMRRYRDEGHEWMGLPDRRELVASLKAEIAERGASTSRELDDGLPRTKQHWGWNWSETKKALEYLFLAGELAVSGRTTQFERLYDLPERVVPREHLDAPTPTPEEADRELVRRAAAAHGVSDVRSLADYFRMRVDSTQQAVGTLVEDGELVPVEVEGWRTPAYLHRDARLPRKVGARALLSPFDPVVWERSRTEKLFGFRYRIEIYVREAERVHGYYVLPFLLGDTLVGRVDLKADRATGTLRVRGTYTEPGAPAETVAELAAELQRLAGWLGLETVAVEPRGDAWQALAAETASGPAPRQELAACM